MRIERIMIIYLIIVNLLAFILYGVDKKRAINREWRISEKTLLGIAVVGGSIGAIFGMYAFHHKTRHWYFRCGLPVILIIQGLLVWFIYYNGLI